MRFSNSIDAHRLTKWAAPQLTAQGLAQLIEHLYRACFAENRILSDRSVLLEAAAAAGLDPEAASVMLDGDAGRAEVFADTAAGDRVLEVIPYFTAEGVVLTGEVTPPQVDIFLSKAAAVEEPAAE